MSENFNELPNEAGDEDAISERAASWLVQREEGLTPEQTEEFNDWLRSDPRHAAAVAQLEQTCALLEDLPIVAGKLHDLRKTGLAAASAVPVNGAAGIWQGTSRRAVRALAVAASLALGALGWQWWGSLQESPVRYATSTAGYKRVILADGSVLELNAATDLRVKFSASERWVALTAGEAHFSVARDPLRPFVVSAGDVSIRAVGTAFNVRLASTGVEVLVTEGKVQVASEPTARAPVASIVPESPLVQAGERVVIPRVVAPVAPLPRVEKITETVMREALSWQERNLVFSETPLSDVIVQFNQRNFTQLVILDEELGSRLVGGVFSADNVGAFVRLLEEAGDVVAERGDDRVVILRKAR